MKKTATNNKENHTYHKTLSEENKREYIQKIKVKIEYIETCYNSPGYDAKTENRKKQSLKHIYKDFLKHYVEFIPPAKLNAYNHDLNDFQNISLFVALKYTNELYNEIENNIKHEHDNQSQQKITTTQKSHSIIQNEINESEIDLFYRFMSELQIENIIQFEDFEEVLSGKRIFIKKNNHNLYAAAIVKTLYSNEMFININNSPPWLFAHKLFCGKYQSEIKPINNNKLSSIAIAKNKNFEKIYKEISNIFNDL